MVFDTFEWLVNLCSCIPNKEVEIVIYYGKQFFSYKEPASVSWKIC